MASAVVVDTMIASAWLGVRESPRKARWATLLERSAWVLTFTVVAEMRFGAEVAGWGARRREALDRLIASAGSMPPLREVTDAYVDVRSWCVRNGHGLGAKEHEADRWVAAVAVAASLPLATEDVISTRCRCCAGPNRAHEPLHVRVINGQRLQILVAHACHEHDRIFGSGFEWRIHDEHEQRWRARRYPEPRDPGGGLTRRLTGPPPPPSGVEARSLSIFVNLRG